MTRRVNACLQIHMICNPAQLFPENSYNCYRFFSKMWENIFTVRKYFYLSPNYWRMCAPTRLWSWLLAEKTICDVSRKVSRNCFSQVFLIRAKNLQIWNRNWTFSLSWSKVLKKLQNLDVSNKFYWCYHFPKLYQLFNQIQYFHSSTKIIYSAFIWPEMDLNQ